MVSTISSAAHGGIPKSLAEAIGELSHGNLCIGDVRQILATALENHPEAGESIQEFLDEELQARRLSISDYGELVTGLGAVLSENVPTEWSEDAPEQPGIYRIVDEGTLVLADDDEPFSAAGSDDKVAELKPVKDASDEGWKVGSGYEDELPQIAVGDVLRDRFRLDEEVARGSMGIIYKATDLLKLEADANEPFVAIKLISPEFINHRDALKTFQNEVDNAQHLSHPNIVHLFELDRDQGHFFISMEWLEGESLDALLDRSKGSALPPAQAYAIIEQLCDALAYAHEQHVVHADVKPGNVFLTEPGELKLIDFGIARTNVSSAPTRDRDQAVALTPAYASCERLEKAEPTPQDDLYSLACLIYRLLSGRRVYGAITALEAENLQMEPVRIGGMSDQRWAALAKALAFRRVDRFVGVAEFAEAFGQRRESRDTEVDGAEDLKHTDTMTLPIMTPPIDLGDGKEFAESADASVDFLVDVADADHEPIVAENARELFEQPEPELTDEPTETVNIPVLDSALFDKPTVEQPDSQRQQPAHVTGSIANSRTYTIGVTAAACLVAAVVTWTLLPDDTPRQTQAPAAKRVIGTIVTMREAQEEAGADTEVLAAADAEIAPTDTQGPDPVEETALEQADPFFEEPGQLIAVESVAQTEEPPAAEESPLPEEELFTAADAEVVSVPEIDKQPLLDETALVVEVREEPVIAAAEAPVISAAVAVEMGILNRKTHEALAAGRLLEPSDDNAVLWLDQMRTKDPASLLVATATVSLVESLLLQADQAVYAGDAESATRWTKLAEVNGADAKDIRGLQLLIAELRTQNALQSVAAAEEALAAQIEANEAAALKAAEEAAKPIPLSQLEFINYTEPRIPRLLRDRFMSGWVDVSFTIDDKGATSNIEVVDSDLSRRFEAPSIAAVEQWIFKPYTRRGEVTSVNSAVRLRYEN
ncbi:MAG: protein kinase [Gammaproteobacteria bacterium]|jgi:serine/threonine protein kinase|nr:protein kinase [Gammaproteobacteria bacterium]MDP6616116.1 protein kinase [Gammaproteobacteria bacterium]MDP6694866.1 protein kinase [Gammaproteobacteria bacterium]